MIDSVRPSVTDRYHVKMAQATIRKPLRALQKATHLPISAKRIKWKITNFSGSTPVRRLPYAVKPRENSYKPLLFKNYSSLATFLSLKAHVHSVTHCQLWKPQHIRSRCQACHPLRLAHFKMNRPFKFHGHSRSSYTRPPCNRWHVAVEQGSGLKEGVSARRHLATCIQGAA